MTGTLVGSRWIQYKKCVVQNGFSKQKKNPNILFCIFLPPTKWWMSMFFLTRKHWLYRVKKNIMQLLLALHIHCSQFSSGVLFKTDKISESDFAWKKTRDGLSANPFKILMISLNCVSPLHVLKANTRFKMNMEGSTGLKRWVRKDVDFCKVGVYSPALFVLRIMCCLMQHPMKMPLPNL